MNLPHGTDNRPTEAEKSIRIAVLLTICTQAYAKSRFGRDFRNMECVDGKVGKQAAVNKLNRFRHFTLITGIPYPVLICCFSCVGYVFFDKWIIKKGDRQGCPYKP